jgi:ribosomal protein L32
MNCSRETTKMGVPARHASKARRAGHLATAGCWARSVPERYVAGADSRGRQEGRPYPWSQQVIHEISGLDEYSPSNLYN